MLSLDFKNELIKATPVVGTAAADVASRKFFGLSLNEWFYVVAILYAGVQCWALIYKTLKGAKNE